MYRFRIHERKKRMRTHVIAGTIAVAVLSAVVLIASAQTNAAVTEKKAAPMMSCPLCGMPMADMMGGADMAARMKDMQAKMKEAGVSEESMKAHMAMMNAPLYMDSPEMLLGQADTLGLTDDQKTQLADVVKDARAKAAAVLTEAQRTTLGQVPDKPMTMTEMRAEMMKKMAPMMEKMNKDGAMGGAMRK